jgi:hypothetical protein
MIQFVQENGGVKLAVVLDPQSLHCLMDRLLVSMAEEVSDLSGPIHGLDPDLDCFGFICQDHVIHGLDVTSRLDFDSISGLNLHCCDVIPGGTYFIPVDGPDGVH